MPSIAETTAFVAVIQEKKHKNSMTVRKEKFLSFFIE